MMSSVNTHKRPQMLLCYYFMWEIAQIIQFHKAAMLFYLAFVKLIWDILLKRKMYGQFKPQTLGITTIVDFGVRILLV